MNKMIIDILDTADGYQVYWIHKNGATDEVIPEDLWYDKYSLLEFIEDEIMSGKIKEEDITNYVDEFEEDIIDYFENTRKEDKEVEEEEEEEEEEE